MTDHIEQSSIGEIHSALSKVNIEYSGYSCNGVNLVGDRASIKAAMSAFHSHGQIDYLKTQIRHWREECGKLHAQISSLRWKAEIQNDQVTVSLDHYTALVRDHRKLTELESPSTFSSQGHNTTQGE